MRTRLRPRIPVLQYNDNWVCLNKPAGMSMTRSKNTKHSDTVLTSTVKKQLARKVFPVHRLDHRTSGAILFAFDSQTCGALHESLSRGTKEYVALLRGRWNRSEDTVIVNKPLLCHNTNMTKTAITQFTMLSTQDNATLVLCVPKTGRTHQIRRHAARELGQPIIGDTQHGSSQVNRWWRTNRNLNRLALHSLSISLNDDDDNVMVAPLPSDLRCVLEKEPLWSEAVAREPKLLMEPVDKRGGTHGRHYRKRDKTKPKGTEVSEKVERVERANGEKASKEFEFSVVEGHEHTFLERRNGNSTLTPTSCTPGAPIHKNKASTAAAVTTAAALKNQKLSVTLTPLLDALQRSNLMLFSSLALRLSVLRLIPWRLVTTWTVVPMICLYATAEAVFWALFHFHILPTCNQPAEPQAYRGYGRDRHRLMLRIMERLERTCRATGTPNQQAFVSYINEWFHHDDNGPSSSRRSSRDDDPLEMPRKENMDELFSWAFFGKDHNHLEPWMEEELQLIYDTLERRYNLTFAPGVNTDLRPMRLTLDPLEPAYRPLLIYLLFSTIQLFANFFLRVAGFRFYTTSNGLRYWYRPQQHSIVAPAEQTTTTSLSSSSARDDSQLPLLFFHGIAPGGVAPYLPMLLCGLGRGGRSIMLFPNPAISFAICLRSPTEEETVRGVWEAVETRLGPHARVSVVGHSFGSCQLTWLLHSKEALRIQQLVLVDPVSVLLSEPDVVTNFLYTRKAIQNKSRAIGVVANELFIENFLRRQFAWYNSELWLEDIPPHCRVVVCLAGKDEILNSHKIKREIDLFLEDKTGGKMDLILWEGGGHAFCVSRPEAWKQIRLIMRQQERLIAKEAQIAYQ